MFSRSLTHSSLVYGRQALIRVASVSIRTSAVIAVAISIICFLTGCDARNPSKFAEMDYATDPDGSCEKHPDGYYADKAKTKAGNDELSFLFCQYSTRSNYHLEAVQRGAAGQQTHVAKGITCTEETIALLEALQQVGATRAACPRAAVAAAGAPEVSPKGPAVPVCNQSDANVKVTRFYNEQGLGMVFSVIGELVNNCAEPLGIHVRFTGYDKNGRVVDLTESWPASVRNIRAKGTEPFKTTIFRFNPAIKSVAAEVIEVRRWPPN